MSFFNETINKRKIDSLKMDENDLFKKGNEHEFAKYFSNNEDYAIESIPKNINFFQRKKWIKEKLNLIGDDKALVFIKNSQIMWAYLKDDQKYWLPFEKAQFFLSLFEEKFKCALVVEENESGNLYYGLVDDFLVVYTRNYDEAVYAIKKYSKHSNLKITHLGIGNVDCECDRVLKFSDVFGKIQTSMQSQKKFQDEDDVIYLNEDGDLYDGVRNTSSKNANVSIDEMFFDWFTNRKSELGTKFSFKRICILSAMAFFMIFFFFGGLYYQNSKNEKIAEINDTLEKLYKLGK